MTPLTDEQRDLAARYVPLARRVAGELSRRYGRAIDVQSACHVGLVYAARAWDGQGSFANHAWFYMRAACQRERIASGMIRIPDRKQRVSRDHVRAEPCEHLAPVARDPGPLEAAEASERAANLRAAVDSLEPIQGDIIRSMVMDGETGKAWCARWGVGKGKGEYTKARAIDNLRVMLAS